MFTGGGQCEVQNYKLVKIKAITEKPCVEDVYNMEVENTHCFAVNGGYIVHNCRYATEYIWSGYHMETGEIAAGDFGL